MPRPATISTEQILDAARAVFLEHGFASGSTAEIARRAHVSEGSIFNRFDSKEALFEAAMDKSVPPAFTLGRTLGKGDMKANLVKLTVQSIEFLSQLLPSLMLRWSERERAHGSVTCNRPREILRALTDFFTEEKALGRVHGDPTIMARIFMGGVWNYCFLQTVTGDRTLSAPAFARGFVDGFWHGFAPTTGGKGKRP
jgi:AcrR family transcriptional regulator